MSKSKYVQCGLRLPVDLKVWADGKAKEDKRSFNNYVEMKLLELKKAEDKANERKAAYPQ